MSNDTRHGNINVHGYRRLKRPEHPLSDARGWVLEHRYVMWNAGHLTDPAMHIHHINGDKLDNRIENLAVLTPEQHGREHHEIDRQEARRLYLSGLSTTEVASRLGTFPGNVSRMLRQTGTPARKTPTKLTDSQRAEVRDRLQTGEPANSIAAAMGFSITPVHRIRRELGLPPAKTWRTHWTESRKAASRQENEGCGGEPMSAA